MKNDSFLRSAVVVLVLISLYNAYVIYTLNQKISLLNGDFPSNATATKPRPSSFFVVEKSIPIVAVSSAGGGVVGNVTIKLIPGNNNVLINTNPFTDTDIQYSVNTAVAVAKLNTNYEYDRDFIFDYHAKGAQLIGGGSAGASTAILAMAAIEGKKIRNEAAMTGTINPDGTIGQIGGVLEKAKAVADAGYRYFLVPKGQSTITYYEKQVTKEDTVFGFEIYNTRYVPKEIDLKKAAAEEWNLTMVEVSAISEALPYFIE